MNITENRTKSERTVQPLLHDNGIGCICHEHGQRRNDIAVMLTTYELDGKIRQTVQKIYLTPVFNTPRICARQSSVCFKMTMLSLPLLSKAKRVPLRVSLQPFLTLYLPNQRA